MSEEHSDLDLLRVRNETFLQSVEYHEQLASTNSRALELAREPDGQLPALVITDDQTAGRGRGAHRWWSGRGSLTFTVLLELPQTSVAQAASSGVGSVSLAVGLALVQALEPYLAKGTEGNAPVADLGLKWPNDLYWGRRKLAGILVEGATVAQGRLAIGIGLNVNNSLRHAPDELRETATSLIDELGTAQDRSAVLAVCLQQLEHCLRQHASQPANLFEQWRPYCVLRGKTVSLSTPRGAVTGICLGIDDSGALLISDGAEPVRCMAGEVRILRW